MREITFIEATREALAAAMARDATIFVVGEGIGPAGATSTRPPVSMTSTAQNACGIPPSASAALSACAPARP